MKKSSFITDQKGVGMDSIPKPGSTPKKIKAPHAPKKKVGKKRKA